MKKVTIALAATAIVAAAFASWAGAAAPGTRSPDTEDAAALVGVNHHGAKAQPRWDLRSPDSRDAGTEGGAAQATLDRRSPDVRDASRAAQEPPVVIVSGSGGFDWSDAGIGGVGGFAIAVMVGATAVLLQRTQRRPVARS